MSDLRKAAEDLIEAWAWDWSEPRNEALKERMEALRQALAQPEQEPFIYVREDNEKPFGGYEHCSEADAGAFPVYTAPPKKEWVGLTDAEVEAWRGNYDFFDSTLVREVEAKLKEKNGG